MRPAPAALLYKDLKRTFSCTRSRFAGDGRCLAAARRPLHSATHRLLRRVGLRRPARDPARLPGGAGAAPGGRQPRAEAGPRPRRVDRRRVRRQVRERGPAQSRSSELRARARGGADRGARRASSCARWSGFNRSARFPDGYDPVGARVIGALADGLVLDDHDRQGLRRRACATNQPVVSGAGLVGHVSRRVAGRRARHADHRPHERGVGAGRARTAPTGS